MENPSHRQSQSIRRGAEGTERAGEDTAARRARLEQVAQLLRDELGTKRSDKLLRLFDFLMERTIERRPPTELEIANEVFSIGKTIDSSQDATVRVYVHRLRKLMDEVFKDRPGPRLIIPVGDYSILLSGDAEVKPADEVASRPAAAPKVAPLSTGKRFALGAVCLAAFLAVLLLLWTERDPSRGSSAWIALWQPFAKSARPITIVMGDYFFFGQKEDHAAPPGAPPRLVWDRSVPAREDLDIYLMRKPAEAQRITEQREQYVSSSTVTALEDIHAVLRNVERRRMRPIRLISASQLTPEILKSSDVIYVGLLSGLSDLLRDPLFQASGFRLGETFNDLTDSASGTKYQSDGVVLTEERIPRRDYGYIASLPGPNGNTIVIISGLRAAGLLEMAELAGDPTRIAALGGGVSFRGFEALYRVRAMGNLNLGDALVLRRELHFQGIWDKSMAAPEPQQ